ncbi:MAG TPA: MATE family efflux transporter [Planctomycetota bacterium]|nr:MATE family efflux transporter [Planctomycetota bacterium]
MSPVREEVRTLARLAWPVVASQLGLMLFALVDMAMLGRVGAREMGAAALADACLFGSLIVAMSLALGIDPLVSQAHGAGEGEAVGRALQHGVVVALLGAIPVTFAWLHVGTILRWTGQTPELAALGQAYTNPQIWSIAPALLFVVLRSYVQGRGLMTPPLWIILGTNLLNAFLDWMLIFGHLGMPAMGIRGAGIATGISRSILPLGLALLIFGRGLHHGAWTPWSREALGRGLRRALAIGLPLSFQIGFEVWAFNMCTLIAGKFGEAAVAAHAVVLKTASFTFMVPLGISAAAATRVGNRIGAGDPAGAQRAANVALAIGAGVMCASAAAFLLFPRVLAGFLTTKPEVVAIALTIFPVAAAFQVFDGTQVVGCGILRGMGTPRPGAIFNLVGYYVLALPLGCMLAFRFAMGLRGVWIGLALGLAIIASLLVLWIAYRGPGRGAHATGSAARASAMTAVE